MTGGLFGFCGERLYVLVCAQIRSGLGVVSSCKGCRAICSQVAMLLRK